MRNTHDWATSACRLKGCGRAGLALLAGWALVAGCATTGGAPELPPPIPEGKGRLILETGSIPELNYYVLDQATEEEVYSQTPRGPASSPSAYESGSGRTNLQVDLPAGTYTVVVNTDIKDDVRIPDVEIRMGEEKHVQVPVGRFQLLLQGAEGYIQMPFLIMDYNMRTKLGDGMTSPEVRYFILPEGDYKIRVENRAMGLDETRPVPVSFGRIMPIVVQMAAPTQVQPGSEGQQPAPGQP